MQQGKEFRKGILEMLTYVIVGSGWRAEFYGRIARTYSDLFHAIFLCRSEEKVLLMKARTGVDAVTTEDEAMAIHPDFIVVAVDRAHLVDMTEYWTRKGFPVVVETPVGDNEEKFARLEKLQAQGAKIVCCEQYHRYPILAEGLRMITEGVIGEPLSVYISLAHDYHAASLIRRALKVRGERYTIHARQFKQPVVETDSRDGQIFDGRVGQETLDRAIVSFESGKSAIYDFSGTQYHSFIRSRHITVRCERGEWSDTMVCGLDERNHPWRKSLLPGIPEKYRCLDTRVLSDMRKMWCPELRLDDLQDEFAMATILLDMGDCLKGGTSPYPLWEAIEDARFWMRLKSHHSAPLHVEACENTEITG